MKNKQTDLKSDRLTPLELMLEVLHTDRSIEQKFKEYGVLQINYNAFAFYDTPYDEDVAHHIVKETLKDDDSYTEEFYEPEGFGYYTFIELKQGKEHKIAKELPMDFFDATKCDVPFYYVGFVRSETQTDLSFPDYDGKRVYLRFISHEEVAQKILAKDKERKKSVLENIINLKYYDGVALDISTIFTQIEMSHLLGGKPTTIDELKSMYKQRAKELHPDTNKSEFAQLEFQALNATYEFYEAMLKDNRHFEQPKPKKLPSYDLKAEIKALGMTQKEFAELTGTHTNTISQWIRGVNDMPEWVKHFILHYKKSKLFDELKEKLNSV